MALIICTLRSIAASAIFEKPTRMPRPPPTAVPIANPAAARSKLTPRSLSSVPVVASLNAVRITLLGAGRTCGESHPACASHSQMTTSTTGANHDRS